MNQTPDVAPLVSAVQRARLWFGLLVLVFGIFVVRAFYLQVIRYDHYKSAALSDQMREYTVTPERGIISAYLSGKQVPLVLNQKLYTLYADPMLVKDVDKVAGKLQPFIGGNTDDIVTALKTKNTRYVVLKKKLTAEQSKEVLAFRFPGIGTQEQNYRTYPQGSLAAQLLGFVNDDGDGKYGVEQALDKRLKGQPGQLKAVTDINGVPLAANADNLSVAPVPGADIGLTIDIGMQAGLEKILKAAQEKYQSKDVSAIVMDVNTGAIKAMANYPTFDPSNYQYVDDPALFQNETVSHPIEPGSITKVFTTAAGLQQGVFTPTTSFYDPGSWSIDGARVTDVEEDHSTGQQNILTTLDKSLNTGATWMLMQMGGGQINQKARSALYDYMSNHFMFGRATGIEQGYEATGFLPKPQDTGSGINLTYANVSFGQAYTATALQIVSGFTSVINGGTYYQPYLVDQVVSPDGTVKKLPPTVVKRGVISDSVSRDMVSLLVANNDLHIRSGFTYLRFGPNYMVGGKTGTAEIADPNGGYLRNVYNGTYLGFVGGDRPQYAIVVYNFRPVKYGGYAGSQTGQPVFADIAHMLVDSFGVTPKSH